MLKPQIGIIGGSGLYKIDILKNIESINVSTPFGEASDKYIIGELNGRPVAFLPRHGIGHRILPTELNYRANIYGFKKLGVTRIIAVSAVGSLKENIAPMDIVVPNQFFDRASKSVCTFFGRGLAAHISFADPVCSDLADILYQAAKDTGVKAHKGGTYINIEGPQFSTLAESNLYRQWGMDIIGMTNLCEAKLAREAELCYATLALVTDYDCWHPGHKNVTTEMVVHNLIQNTSNAQKILKQAISKIPEFRSCACQYALKDAVMTDPKFIQEKVKKDLDIIIGKYI